MNKLLLRYSNSYNYSIVCVRAMSKIATIVQHISNQKAKCIHKLTNFTVHSNTKKKTKRRSKQNGWLYTRQLKYGFEAEQNEKRITNSCSYNENIYI